jgi:capsular polysaccharide biosynthesis protein
MNLLMFMRVLERGWWIVVLALVMTVGGTAYFTFTQSPVYQAVATLVVGPKAEVFDPRTSVELLNNLDRRGIVATFARILSSRIVREHAEAQVGLTGGDTRPYQTNVRVLPDTNVLQVSVEGLDPARAQRLANAIANEASSRVREYYEVYQLKVLDPATRPTLPVAPEKERNLGIAVVFGLMLGVMLAFLAEYVRQWKRLPGGGVAPPSPAQMEGVAPKRSDG